nr:MAG TPA: hypothetical protein [Bacteriophage sp.]DAR10801.1 MAG TPA: hypothetical protein [Caudoviricetes sp.]DAX09565.1 MAG TPA: hypothetical protein [Caudoviricetes sp.]
MRYYCVADTIYQFLKLAFVGAWFLLPSESYYSSELATCQ